MFVEIKVNGLFNARVIRTYVYHGKMDSFHVRLNGTCAVLCRNGEISILSE